MEAAKIMKKIIVFSELSFQPCMVCANINLALLEVSEIKIKFLPEDAVIEKITEMADDYDVIVGIGYTEDIVKPPLPHEDKLLLLCSSLDCEEFFPFVSPNRLRENDSIMAKIIQIANGKVDDSCVDIGTKEELDKIIERSQSKIDEEFEYLEKRYSCGVKVIQSLYGCGTKEEIKFHKYFLMEVINEEEIGWVENVLEEYDPMEKETKRLIEFISPLEKNPTTGFLSVEHYHFFETDVLQACDDLHYLTAAIEYKDSEGKYNTIYSDLDLDEIEYASGRVEDNMPLITARLN